MNKKEKIDELIDLCFMGQTELKKYCFNKLKPYYKSFINTKDFTYFKGEIPVLLVAHLDTVYLKKPSRIIIKNEIISSPDGIGGDDRCGVYAIIKIVESGLFPSILFTTDEEMGGVGASAFTDFVKELKNVNFILQIDRRGKNDMVAYDDGNKELLEYIKKFGFKENYGSFSDISIIAPHYEISALNLSSGYYNEHRGEAEYINFNHLQATINRVIKILKDDNNKKFIYEETYSPQLSSNYWENDYKGTLFKSYGYKKEDYTKVDKDDYKICGYCGLTADECSRYGIELHDDGTLCLCDDCIYELWYEVCSACGNIQDRDIKKCVNCGYNMDGSDDYI